MAVRLVVGFHFTINNGLAGQQGLVAGTVLLQ